MTKSAMILAFLVFSFSSVEASEAIGYYSSGSLKEAESIKDRGTNIRKLFLQRQRFYGTTQIQDIISDAADFVRQEFPDAEVLQVGDIANKSGGVLAEHGSHQNGLDVDIVYLTKNGRLQSQSAPYWEEDFVKKGVMSANLHVERNLALFKYLIINKSVERIFVDQAIKVQFCSYAKKNNLLSDPETKETLRRLRVEKLHSTHFHMRIKCPTTDLKCKAQVAVPEGTGC
jgi:penicillin-insensitive murein endopeptidase